MKKFKFYYNPVEEAFTDWVFDKLDTAIIPLDSE